MLKEAIQQIQTLAIEAEGVTDVDVGGIPHFIYKGRLTPLVLDLAHHLTVRTLGGVVDYAKHNRDGLDLDKLTITVDGPGVVSVRGPALKDGRRALHLVAAEPDASQSFDRFVNRFMSIEDFVIGAQRHFRTGFGDVAALLAVVGNITQNDVRQVDDDGISQTVTQRAGITKSAVTTLPSPTLLCPRRSFPEIELDLVPFIVRVKKAADEKALPTVALFECDGDNWKVDAAGKIVEFFAEHLHDDDEGRTLADRIAVLA